MKLFAAALGTALFVASPSQAQMVAMSGDWLLDLGQVPAHVALRKGEDIARIPMLPRQLVRVEEDVLDPATGALQASRGGYFIRFSLADGQAAFCSTLTTDGMRKGQFHLIGYVDRHLCFFDRDNDGRFEAGYEIRSGLMSRIPVLTRAKVEGAKPVVPARYAAVPSSESDLPLTLALTWRAGRGLGDKAVFLIYVCDATRPTKKNECLQFSRAAGLDAVPGTFSFAGLTFAFSSKAENTGEAQVSRAASKATMTTNGASVSFSAADDVP